MTVIVIEGESSTAQCAMTQRAAILLGFRKCIAEVMPKAINIIDKHTLRWSWSWTWRRHGNGGWRRNWAWLRSWHWPRKWLWSWYRLWHRHRPRRRLGCRLWCDGARIAIHSCYHPFTRRLEIAPRRTMPIIPVVRECSAVLCLLANIATILFCRCGDSIQIVTGTINIAPE